MNSICRPTLGQTACARSFAGQTFQLDASGALYWVQRELLIVSDLHFEKGSFFSGLGNPLPLLDTLDTLRRLRALIDRYAPREVLCLGDSFHDPAAFARMRELDLASLNSLVRRVQSWTWVLGNHDPSLPATIAGHKVTSWDAHGICFSHEPKPDAAAQVVGHFHPKVNHRVAGQRLSGRCFVMTRNLVLMPSFGTFTGGLSVRDPAIQNWLTAPAETYLLFKGKIWRVDG